MTLPEVILASWSLVPQSPEAKRQRINANCLPPALEKRPTEPVISEVAFVKPAAVRHSRDGPGGAH